MIQQVGRLDSARMDSPQSRRDDPNRAKSMEFLLDEDNKSALQVSLHFRISISIS